MNHGGWTGEKENIFFQTSNRLKKEAFFSPVKSTLCYFNIRGTFIEKGYVLMNSLSCFLPLCLGEDKQLTSEMVLDSNLFSSCFFWFF